MMPQADDRIAANLKRLKAAGAPDEALEAYLREEEAKARPAPAAAPRDATQAMPTEAPKPRQSLGQAALGAVGKVAQGLSFGMADEAAALGASLARNPRRPTQHYETYKTAINAPVKQFGAEHPALGFAAEVAGGMGAGGLIRSGVNKLRGGAPVAKKALGWLPKATEAAQDVAKGTAGGAVYGAGTAETGQRLEGAQSGAAWGAGTVAGFKGIGALASARIRGTSVADVLSNLMPRPANASSRAGRAFQQAGGMTTDDLAHADVLKQIERAGLSLDDVTANASKAHPEQMLLDPGVGGKMMTRRARGVQSIPSQGSGTIETALTSRAENAPGRVQTAVESGLGHTRENAVERAEQLAAQRKTTANVKYPEAYDAPPIEDPDVLSIFSDPVFRKAHAVARRMAKREGVDLPPLMRTSEVGGVPVKELVPQPVQAFDWMKHGLDDLIETGSNGQRVMGRNEARITRNKLALALERIDANPEHAKYAEARRAFREGSQVMEAQESGLDFLRASRDEIAANFPRLTPAQQDEFRRSAVSAVGDRLSKVTDGGDVTRVLRNPLIREKLQAIAPTPGAYAKLESAIAQEAEMHRTGQTILGGSPTARILAEQGDDLGGGVQAFGHVANAASGGLAGLGRFIATNALTARGRGLGERQANALAPLLTAKGADLDAILKKAGALSSRQTSSAQTRAALLRAIGQATGAGHNQP